MEELIKQQAPAAAPPSPPPSFGIGDRALRFVLEYTADQQRQRKELGKLALAPPPVRGLARVTVTVVKQGVCRGTLTWKCCVRK